MSYLAWPVTLSGQSQTAKGNPYHLTLAYFGKEHVVTLGALKEALAGIDLTPINHGDEPEWEHDEWNTEKGRLCGIFLRNPPERMLKAWRALVPVMARPFPEYTPHITIEKELAIYQQSRRLGEIVIDVGPLMLMGLF